MGRQSISKNKRRKIALSDKIVSSSKSVISDKDADDKNSGLIKISAGDVIYNRFEVLRKCGQGTFGTVLSCYDKNKQKKVAIKAIRSVRRYLKSADIEIKILEKIYKADLHDDSLCVKLRKSFTDHVHGRRHKFIVFEKLGCSLYDFISQNNYKGFSLRHVKEFSYQILKAVRFCHRMNLIHTDLKPENVLFVDDTHIYRNNDIKSDYLLPCKTDIRLIDFGGATFDDDHHSRIINTRQYRAPEVILGLGWSFPSDLWSIGCIICELYVGELLFGTHANAEHLAMMEKVTGRPIPSNMVKRAVRLAQTRNSTRNGKSRKRRARSDSAPKLDEIFSREGYLRWPEIALNKESKNAVASTVTLKQIGEASEDSDFENLILKLLTFEPEKRITAEEALRHAFFDNIRRDEKVSGHR